MQTLTTYNNNIHEVCDECDKIKNLYHVSLENEAGSSHFNVCKKCLKKIIDGL